MDEFEELARSAPPREILVATPPRLAAVPKSVESKEDRDRREREEHKRERLHDYRTESGVPVNFRGFRLEAYETKTKAQKNAVDGCKWFLDQYLDCIVEKKPCGLWLIGPPGTGKTRLAAALVTTVFLDDQYPAALTTPLKLIRRLRDCWSRDAREKETQVIEHFASLDLLVIDDIGTGWGTAAEITQLTEVIDERYTRCLPTVITSNLDVDQLHRELGPRAFDRLLHGARKVAVLGDSYRQPAQEPTA